MSSPHALPPLESTPLHRLIAASPSVFHLLLSFGAFTTRHNFGRTLGEHLLSTAYLLRLAGVEDDVVDAGALHSIYSTAHYATALTRDRARVLRAAGARAEALAFLFCCIDRPATLLALSLPLPDGPTPLKLRGDVARLGYFFSSTVGAHSAVHVSPADLHALLLMEAANLLDQGDGEVLRAALRAPPGAPLRAAIERVHSCSALPALHPARQRLSWSSRLGLARRLPFARLLCARPPSVVELPPQPTADSADAVEYGCIMLDDDAGGPLCPPHLTPILSAAPSPAHAALVPQRAGPTLRLSAALRRALEVGVTTVTPRADRGDAFSSAAIRAAAALPGQDAQRRAVAAALTDGLIREGFLRIDGGDDARLLVERAFEGAASFFSQPLGAKRAAHWRAAGRPHGFVSERDREFFIVRDQAAATGGVDVSAAQRAWQALFEAQRAIARDIYSLLATHAGVLRQADDASGAGDFPSLDALFGEVGEGRAPDLMRVYRYSRHADGATPNMRGAATSAHTDAGLLTVAPCASAPGLSLLTPTGTFWVDVEGEACEAGAGARRFIVFLGEAGARLLAGPRAGKREGVSLPRAAVHWVRDGSSPQRYSAPFFLRAPADAALVRGTEAARGIINREFIETLVQRPWARARERAAGSGGPPAPAAWAADFL